MPKMEELYRLAREALADHALATPPPWDIETMDRRHPDQMYVAMSDEHGKSIADNLNASHKVIAQDGGIYYDPEGSANLGFCARARDREHRLAALLAEIQEAGPNRDCYVGQSRPGAWHIRLDGMGLSWNRLGMLQIIHTLLRAIEEG